MMTVRYESLVLRLFSGFILPVPFFLLPNIAEDQQQRKIEEQERKIFP